MRACVYMNAIYFRYLENYEFSNFFFENIFESIFEQFFFVVFVCLLYQFEKVRVTEK
jgi:hypothetical protein